MKNSKIYLFTLIFFISVGFAKAQNPLAPAYGFNVFTLYNYTINGGDVEGGFAVGGNFKWQESHYQGDGQGGGSPYGTVSGVNYATVVNGNIDWSNSSGQFTYNIYNNNWLVKFGNLNGGTYNSANKQLVNSKIIQFNNPSASQTTTSDFQQSKIIDFTAQFDLLKANSVSLSNCNNTVTPTINGSDYTITTLNNGTNIWNITGADLDNINNLKFGVNGLPSNTKTLIINVNAAGTFNYTPSTFELQRTQAKYIIWNFYNTTTLNLSGNVLEGSVLAPLADVTKAVNNIEGQVIAKSYIQNGSGETHVATFEGNFTCGNCINPPNAGLNGSYSICDNNLAPINLLTKLNGSPQTGGTWVMTSGTGGTLMGSMFTPIAGNHNYVFTYTIQGTAPCNDATATVTLTIKAHADAGQSATYEVCDSDLSPINLFNKLNGTPQSGGTWVMTSGTGGALSGGTFTPIGGNHNYIFTYTVAGTSPCASASSTVTVNVKSHANAGTDGTYEVCDSDLSPINLYSKLIGSPHTGGIWTQTGTGGNLINGVFTPVAGTATYIFKYTVSGNSPCLDATSTIIINVKSQVFVNAGDDAVICANVNSDKVIIDETTGLPIINTVQLNGSIIGGITTGTWTANISGGTFTPNASALNAVYTPPFGVPTVILTLTSNDPVGPCGVISDNMTVTQKPCAGIIDPCTCHDTKYSATDILEVIDFIEIDGTPGQTWTISQNGGGTRPDGGVYGTMQFIDNTPPLDNITIPVGTLVPETAPGSGVYRLDFAHDSGAGYNVVVTNATSTPTPNPSTELSINNFCVLNTFTPNFNVGATVCNSADPIPLSSLIVDTDPGTIGTIVVSPAGTVNYFYTLNGGATEFPLVGDFNPALFNPNDVIKIIAKYTPDPQNVVDCQLIRNATGNFTISSCVLSVDLLGFTGKANDQAINLNWQTANEKDFSHYEVLRSSNTKEFSSIGSVEGNHSKYYNFTDNNPNQTDNYYRLKMVNNDGSFDFSKILNINFEKGEGFVNIENPTNNGIITIGSNLKNPTFELFNEIGAKIEIVSLSNGYNKYIVKPVNNAHGIYFIKIISDGKMITKKVLMP